MQTELAPSLTDNVAPLDAGAHVTAAAWLGDTVAFALGDGAVVLAKDGATHRVAAHPDGAILAAAGDGERLVTGGDDGPGAGTGRGGPPRARAAARGGRGAVTGRDGSTRELAATGGAWIDALALHQGGGIAWSAGKNVTARDDKGREKTYQAPSSVRGLAFAPKGYRLAMSHYNGATLWFPNLDAKPEPLEWKGSHLDVT